MLIKKCIKLISRNFLLSVCEANDQKRNGSKIKLTNRFFNVIVKCNQNFRCGWGGGGNNGADGA